MALSPDSLFDIAKVIVVRAAIEPARRRHKRKAGSRELPCVESLTPVQLRPPTPIDPAFNGYLRAISICDALLEESPTDADTIHRAFSLTKSRSSHEIEASRAALAKYDAALDEIAAALDENPHWQVPAPNDHCDLPELTKLKKLGHSFMLRSVLRHIEHNNEGADEDFGHAVALAGRLKRCQGFMLHLVVGVAMDSVAQQLIRRLIRSNENRAFGFTCLAQSYQAEPKAEVIEAFRSEFGRVCIPRTLIVRPWYLPAKGSPAWYELPILLAQWILANHPEPDDPAHTVNELVAIFEMLVGWVEDGWAVAPAIDQMRRNYAEGWPEQLSVSAHARKQISLSELIQARRALAKAENPFGRLQCAQVLFSALEIYRAALLGYLRACQTRVLAATVQLGRTPTFLEELVGNGYLSEIPTDPFTDAHIGYEPNDAAIWSPGPNGLTYEEAKRCAAGRRDSPYWLSIDPKRL